MTEDQIRDLEDTLSALPARPQSYSYEGTVRPTSKSTGYADYHVHSVCGGQHLGTKAEKHHCIGNVIAKDEGTAACLARLLEAAPLLLDEVKRLRGVLKTLSDDAAVESAIEAAYQLGGDGVHCAYKEVQAVAREALGERS